MVLTPMDRMNKTFKCDAIKQNESEVEKYQILFFGICYLRII